MDAVVLILAILALCVPFAIAKLWWWVGFWVGLSVLLGIIEAAAFFITGKTISQKFWAWRRDPATPKWLKWTVLGGMIGFWIYVVLHLFLP